MTPQNFSQFENSLGLSSLSSSRWIWMAGSAAAAAGGVSVDAGTVQITLTGEQVSNGDNPPPFTGDLTGDGVVDVPWGVSTGGFTYRTDTASLQFSYPYRNAAVLTAMSNRIAFAAYFSGAGSGIIPRGRKAKAGSATQFYASTNNSQVNARALIPFTFSDQRINNGSVTNAFADIHAFSISDSVNTVQIVRTVFDDASTVAPDPVAAGGSDAEWVAPVAPPAVIPPGNPEAALTTAFNNKIKKLKKKFKKAKSGRNSGKAKKIKAQIKKFKKKLAAL